MDNLVARIRCMINYIEAKLKLRPNRIILGTQKFEELRACAEHFITNAQEDIGIQSYFMNIPITIDDVDVNRCSACLEFKIFEQRKEEN